MIEEVLPQGPVTGTPEDGDFTKDLSSILKNLKRVEQGLDGNYIIFNLLFIFLPDNFTGFLEIARKWMMF